MLLVVKIGRAMAVVSDFVYTVSVEHQTEERFWFLSRGFKVLLCRHWPSAASLTEGFVQPEKGRSAKRFFWLGDSSV